MSIEGKACDCCCANSESADVTSYFEGKASLMLSGGIGMGIEGKAVGLRAGLSAQGPNLRTNLEAKIQRECNGTVSGGIVRNWSARLQGNVGGGIGLIGGGVTGYSDVIFTMGISVDSDAVTFPLKLQTRKSIVELEVNVGLFQWQRTLDSPEEPNVIFDEEPVLYEF